MKIHGFAASHTNGAAFDTQNLYLIYQSGATRVNNGESANKNQLINFKTFP